jgi:hypothetical protein
VSSNTLEEPKFSLISKNALKAPLSIPLTRTEVTVGISEAKGNNKVFSDYS